MKRFARPVIFACGSVLLAQPVRGAEAFVRSELFGKLGIATYGWQRDLSGLPIGGSRSSISSRAMVKLGALAINKGTWDGEQAANSLS
ncbi:MAG: hypothetical protein AAF654_07360 [Myxococcota bacterium]